MADREPCPHGCPPGMQHRRGCPERYDPPQRDVDEARRAESASSLEPQAAPTWEPRS